MKAMSDKNRSIFIGVALIVIGLLCNKLFIELLFIPDRRIESAVYNAGILGFQLLAIGSGIWFLFKKPSIRFPSRTELILLTSSIFLTVFLLEAGARLWLNFLASPEQYDRFVLFTSIKPEEFAFTPHPYLGYYPTPNYTKGQTHHNSLGYRSEEIAMEKPEGVFRIAVLGGSSTYDVRIEDNAKIFTAQLESRLKDEYGYENVEVINAGVPGYNTWEMLVNLEFRVLDLDPDLVIIYENTNDVHARMVEPSSYRGDDSGRRKIWQVPPVPVWERSAVLRILSRAMNITRQVSIDDFTSAPTYMSWPFESRLSENGVDPGELLEENPPVYYRRNVENMVAIARENDVNIMLSTWAYSPFLNDYASQESYQHGFDENNQVIREVAAEQEVPLFDFASEMPQDPRYWADGRHSSEEGALLKAELFAAFINSLGLIKQ